MRETIIEWGVGEEKQTLESRVFPRRGGPCIKQLRELRPDTGTPQLYVQVLQTKKVKKKTYVGAEIALKTCVTSGGPKDENL